MKHRISIEAAQNLLLSRAHAVGSAKVPLLNALGGVLSEDITASRWVPPFDRAAMDGYVLYSKDTESACLSQPVLLGITETMTNIAAPDRAPIARMLCAPIGTGDPIPAWGDAVIQYEETEICGEQLRISRPLPFGHNIVRQGEDVQVGAVIARKGTRIDAPVVGVLAALGLYTVPVYRSLRIAFISTGREIVDLSDEIPPGKIFDSNYYGLAARCRELGTEAVNLGIVPDDIEKIGEQVAAGVDSADLVVTTGGVSVHHTDLVGAALQKMGTEMLFQGMDMKPGSPTLCGMLDGKLIISLSGNPAAAKVAFELIVVPVIKRLMGLEIVLPNRFSGLLGEGFSKASPQRRLLRGRVERYESTNLVQLTGNQSNSVLTSFINCNALIDVPAGSGPLLPAQAVEGFLID